MRRFGLALPIAALALVAALPAAAKEGVKATLTTSIPLDAPAGTRLHVAWTLASADGTPFGAGGIFVRLVSASGAGAETAFASAYTGEYTATVRVPEGGIGDVEIGIRGFTSGPTGRHRADVVFPITNDPVPGTARVVAAHSARGPTIWIYVLVVGSLCALAVLAVALVWRKNSSGAARSATRGAFR
jgi:hypothetical protein